MGGEVGALQQSLNKLTKPKNVIDMLKDKQDYNMKQKVISLQENNIHM